MNIFIFGTGEPNCPACHGSRIEQVYVGHGSVHESPCSVCCCPKCGYPSGDDWSQCKGSCPHPGSPHFKEQP